MISYINIFLFFFYFLAFSIQNNFHAKIIFSIKNKTEDTILIQKQNFENNPMISENCYNEKKVKENNEAVLSNMLFLSNNPNEKDSERTEAEISDNCFLKDVIIESDNSDSNASSEEDSENKEIIANNSNLKRELSEDSLVCSSSSSNDSGIYKNFNTDETNQIPIHREIYETEKSVKRNEILNTTIGSIYKLEHSTYKDILKGLYRFSNILLDDEYCYTPESISEIPKFKIIKSHSFIYLIKKEDALKPFQLEDTKSSCQRAYYIFKQHLNTLCLI